MNLKKLCNSLIVLCTKLLFASDFVGGNMHNT